jgi:uncharacterized protein DUF4440
MHMKNHKNEVIEIERRLAAAYEQCNVADFELLVLDSCVVADEGRVRTKPEEAKYVARPASNIKVSIGFEVSVASVYDNCAILVGYLSETIDTGKAPPAKSRFLLSDVFLRSDGMWKLAARHQTRMPDDKKEIVFDDSNLLSRNAGEYLFTSGVKLQVLLRDNKLYARVAGGEQQHLRPLSPHEFFVTAFDAEMTFVPDSEGGVDTIMLRQGGQVSFAYKHPQLVDSHG